MKSVRIKNERFKLRAEIKKSWREGRSKRTKKKI